MEIGQPELLVAGEHFLGFAGRKVQVDANSRNEFLRGDDRLSVFARQGPFQTERSMSVVPWVCMRRLASRAQ